MSYSQTMSVCILGGYFILVVMAAKIFSKKIETLKDFFLAGRKLTALPVALTFTATWFGAASTMGSIDAFHNNGISGLWYLILPSIISCVCIALFMAKRVARQTYISQPEAVEAHYGKTGRLFLAIIILLSITGFVASQTVAAGLVFKTFFGLDIVWSTIISVSAVVLYSMMGGYFAVVITDILQVSLIVLSLLVLVVFSIAQSGILDSGTTAYFIQQPDSFWALGDNLTSNLALTTSFVLAWVTAPEMWQRMSSTPDEKTAQKACWQAITLLFLLFIIVTIIGLLSVNLVSSEKGAMVDLARLIPNPFLSTLVLIGFVAAVTSSMDSGINIGSLTITNDIYKGFIDPNASPKKLLWLSRFATILVVIPATLIALNFQDIIKVLWMSADIYASAMFFPIVGLLYLKNPPKWSGVLAMGFGLTMVIISTLVHHNLITLPFYWPPSPYSTLLGVLLSGVGFGLGYLLPRVNSESSY